MEGNTGPELQGHELQNLPLTIIEPPSGWLHIRWRELWQAREVCLMLALRHIKVRYRQAVLGGIWAVLQPLAAALVFTFVFRNMVGETYGVPYILFAYAGMLVWILLASTVAEASTILVDSSHLITKVYFPRLLVPLSALGFTLLDFLLGLVVLTVFMIWFGVVPGLGALLLPLVALGVVGCAVGISALLAALTVKYRDFKFVIPFALQLWLFLSPVIYPVERLPEWVQKVIIINPMSGWIMAFRHCILGTPVNAMQVVVATVTTLALLLLGLNYFRQTEDTFSDIV
jgi:lipopolysaccharide transport system permease protein